MADLRNFEKWDPGVTHSRMVEGTEPGADAAYLVKVKGAVLRYETKEFLPHSRTVVEAVSKLLRSYDIIEVEPSGDGVRRALRRKWVRFADDAMSNARRLARRFRT